MGQKTEKKTSRNQHIQIVNHKANAYARIEDEVIRAKTKLTLRLNEMDYYP